MKRWFLVGAVIGTLVPIVGGGLVFLLWQKTEIIAFGVHIQGNNIGGMRATDARRILESRFAFPPSVTVAITFQGQAIGRVSLEELRVKPDLNGALKIALEIGRRKSFMESLVEFLTAWRDGIYLPMVYNWDEQSGCQILNRIAKSLNCPPKRALVEWQKGTVRIVPSRKGFEVSIEETLKAWTERLKRGQWETLPLTATEIQPEVTTEDVANIDGVIGQATTYFRTSERNRTHNIRLAASRLDHVLIRPGETISFNEIVGPRTPRRGFRVARVLMQGQFTEDFGGGVCQVAGTLYLAALRAGMEVVQRQRHSRPIGYLPPGLDATVNFGSLDLKLRNPFDTPLYLRTFVKGGRLTVFVLGKKQGVTYKIVRTVKKFSEPTIKRVFAPDLPASVRELVDKGNSGYRVTVWRLKVEKGIVTRRELVSSDIYPPRPILVRVGQASEKKSNPSLQTHQPVVSTNTDVVSSPETEEPTSSEPTAP
ncbi:MAG: VanW family protein [Armatimonadetes bacterium]|nr:VanW family protein [Armatimonadota bacterium]MCX7967945.1 VanW family protein [Armatimonadota bacterium]MDW8143285.1 VanW family protein [Armatimonadota bacterium]